MNEKQFSELCKICDNILTSPQISDSRVGISWLHVIREHPVFLSKYQRLFNLGNRLEVIIFYFKKLLQYSFSWVKQIALSIHGRALLTDESSEFPSKIDILFVSHYLNTSLSGNDEDFYFGKLPYEISSFGYTSVIALINHTNEHESYISSKWKNSKIKRVIFSKTLGFLGDIKILKNLVLESNYLSKLAKRENPGLFKLILRQASIEALSSSTRNTLVIYSQIAALIKKLNPRVILITHEGHSWERLAFAAARDINPLIKCIGYQHSALFRMQHAIKRKLDHKFNPDLILTSGIIGKNQLEASPGLMGIPIRVLGSNRSIKATKYSINFSKSDLQSKNSCVVLPEGDIRECDILFNFSIACAYEFPMIKFIWRLHPLITFDVLAQSNDAFRNLPKNIILSNSPIEEDFSFSHYALYRGTTAIVQAVGEGLLPIYLQLPGEMTIDPLYQINIGKINISSVKDFGRVISVDNQSNTLEHSRQEMLSVKSYCQNFFSDFNIEALLPLLK